MRESPQQALILVRLKIGTVKMQRTWGQSAGKSKVNKNPMTPQRPNVGNPDAESKLNPHWI